MKTIEEKRLALLAECATLCPNEGDKINILGDAALLLNCGDSIWKLNWKYMDGKIWLSESLPDWLVDFAYRLLGLETRDAVAESEDKRHELRTAIESLVGIKYELESRNAALVAALEEIRNICTEVDEHPDYTFAEDDAKLFIGICDRALTANTEKGGVQG